MTSSVGQGLELRAPALADVPALAAFFRAVQTLYGAWGPAGEDEIRHELTSGLIDRERDARIAWRGDAIVGTGQVWDQTRTGERIFIGVQAHPRERPVYAALLDWAESRAEERATARPAVLRAWRGSEEEELEAELLARGFELIRHFFRMQIELDEEPPAPEWPEGVSLRTFEPGDERPTYDAVVDAFTDHWDFVPIPYEDWIRFGPESPTFEPELQFIAVDGDEIAGVALCQAERRPETGHVGILGVRPAWRRRGLALALLRHSFRELRRRGRPRADLGVDAENTTGAVRLYERAGMRAVKRSDTYERTLT